METAQEKRVNFGRRPCSCLGRSDYKEEICFFCDEHGGTAGLHCACTHETSKVRKCAIELEDSFLLYKLAAGDVIATGPSITANAWQHSTTKPDLLNRCAINQMILTFVALHLLNWLHLWRIFVWNKTFLLSSSWLIWQSYTKPAGRAWW